MTVHSEVAGYITQADNVSIITGAGASKAAGIPMAGQMVKMVCKEFGHCLVSLSEEDRTDYGKVMRKLSRKDRESFIQPLLDNSGINWGQIALALMLQNNHVARVLTFNFDLVLERAAALLDLQLPIYDFGAAPAGATDIQRVSSQTIIHLHGQSNGLVLLNTEQETKEHGEKLRPILADTVQRHVTIVTGYSGQNDAALDVIVEEYTHSPNHLLWLGYSKSPPAHLKPLLDRDYVRYFGGCDFDLTMIAVAKELGIWPPQLINNPMLHLLEELKPVKDYPVQEKAEVDVLDETRKRLTEHAEAWDGNSTPNDAAFAGLVGGGIFFILITTLPHAAARVDAFTAALRDPNEASWHVQQSLIALGRGGLTGVGLGESTQKFGPLPFAHTDGVFAIVGEELGLMGSLLVILMFGMLLWRGFRAAQNARDSYGSLLAIGITCWLGFQSLINVAVITAVIPFTGIPLPFLSYGGSSLLISLLGVGILLNISRDAAMVKRPQRRSG